MLYLGIDQHRKQLTVNLLNEAGKVVLRRQVSTRWKQVREFLQHMQTLAQAEGGWDAIVEVCGFNDWLLSLLVEYGCAEVVLVQPESRSKQKTDRRDASSLAELLWINRLHLARGDRLVKLRRVEPASPQDAAGRQVTMMRERLVRARTKTINRVQHLLLKHNLQQECPTKGLQTKRAHHWLLALKLPLLDRLEMDQLLKQWALWDEQVRQVEDQIGRQQVQHGAAQVLATLPGGKAYSSLTLASRVGDVRRFRSGAALANYWGLCPSCRNSGDAQGRSGSITKQGSAPARFVLAQMVLQVLRRDAWMRAWYKGIRQRRGSKIARVAVMRRLATIIWHMLRWEEPYCAGGPAEVRAHREHRRACQARQAAAVLTHAARLEQRPSEQAS